MRILRGQWRLQRRILTNDVRPIWLAMLAERLCLDLADRPYGRDQAIVSLTLGAIAQVLGSPSFDVPASREPAKESLGLILSYGYGRE